MFHFRVTSHVNDLAVVQHGWLFVDFFFVLSGFVLAHAYGERLRSGQVDGFRFMLLRIGRIYPLHLVLLATMILFEGMLATGILPRLASESHFRGAEMAFRCFQT